MNCIHVEQIQNVAPSADGCEDCLKSDGRWVHLRICLICGHAGCCDSSPSRHATKHFQETGHPIMQSLEDEEFWVWCYVDQAMIGERDKSWLSE